MSKITATLLFLGAAALAFGQAPAPAEKEKAADQPSSAELDAVAGNNLTEEQKTALAAIDARMVGVERLAAKIDDPDYKEEVAEQIQDLKKRRLDLEKNFDQGLYEALMHSVISRYQVIALWLKPPALPPPPGFKVPPVKKPAKGKSSDNAPGSY